MKLKLWRYEGVPCRRRRLVLCMGVNKKEKRNKKRGRMERHTEKARWRKWEERELYGGKRGNG